MKLRTINKMPHILDTSTGTMRVLGCLKDPNPVNLPLFCASFPTAEIPESEWEEFSHVKSGWTPDIYDQGQQGSCVGHGAVGAFTQAWNFTGAKRQRFSPCYVYSRINGGRDQGAIPSDALEILKNGGVCLESTVPAGRIYPSQYDKAKADAEAKRFRVADAYRLNSFKDLMLAAQTREFTGTFGIDLGQSFEPGSDGRIPTLRGSGGGHMMYVSGAKKFGSEWYLEIVNSWGRQWGINGVCYMENSYFDNYGLDAWAIRAVITDPELPPAPELE